MKKYRIIIMVLIMLSITGCTTYLKDEDNKSVVYEKTGQVLAENIICKPENKEIIKLYDDNNVSFETLPSCSSFKITDGGYEGLWNTFLVRPLAWIVLKLGGLVRSYGLSLMVIGFLIRAAMYPVTKGTAMQSEKLAKIKPEIDRIEKKYKDKTSQEDMMNKSKETMMIYQKNHINPLSSCLFAFLQLPLFLAFLEAVNRVPAIFEDNFLTLQLGTTPLKAILNNGQYQYVVVVVVLALVTYFSVKLNKTVSINADAANQMAFMNKFMIFFIPVISLTMSTAISLYWITSSTFTIIQNILMKRSDA